MLNLTTMAELDFILDCNIKLLSICKFTFLSYSKFSVKLSNIVKYHVMLSNRSFCPADIPYLSPIINMIHWLLSLSLLYIYIYEHCAQSSTGPSAYPSKNAIPWGFPRGADREHTN